MRAEVVEVAVDAAAGPASGPEADARAAVLQDRLARVLGGEGPALLPLPGAPHDDLLRQAAGAPPVAAGAALLLPTSGSTGLPRLVELSAAALTAGAAAGEQVLGGPAHWVLALPLAHVAGWNVLVRGVVAGTEPAALPAGSPFTASGFVEAVDRLRARAGDAPLRTALVPTQLVRLLDDVRARQALQGLDAVLLGGAAAPPSLLARARSAGVRVVTTYGSTETSGGCVYDGRPLPGARAEVDGDGRVLLGGTSLASGYRGDPRATAETFVEQDGERWLRTSDAGREDDGRLVVLGRLDDVVVTGGEKVAPAAVEAVLGELGAVREALVVGVPDPAWGSAVVAVVVPRGPGPTHEAVRELVAARLGRAAAPRHLVLVEDLPRRALGKPDRRAAAALAAARLAPRP